MDREHSMKEKRIAAWASPTSLTRSWPRRTWRRKAATWTAAWASAGETEGAAGDGWTKPHFFVSNPGYFAAYFIAGFLAKEIYRYADREGRDLFDFIRNEICNPGTELEYEVLLEKVLKS
jgi:hypothetical protein